MGDLIPSSVDLSENFQLQLSEIEMLQSMYPNETEFSVTLPHVLADMELYIGGKTKEVPCELDFIWCQDVSEHKLEANVCLPHTYPSSKPLVSCRSVGLDRHQHRQLNSDLSHYIDGLPEGELCAISVINWLTDNACSYYALQPPAVDETTYTTDIAHAAETFCRMWIYSHHIYSKFKRRDIVDAADDLKLTGFSLPGKPGFVCIEGSKRDCCEFLQGLKHMSWKKISLVREELQECGGGAPLDTLRKFEGFQEISFQVRRGPAREYHMDMGQFFKYLEERGCSYAFQDLFGIEGHSGGGK